MVLFCRGGSKGDHPDDMLVAGGSKENSAGLSVTNWPEPGSFAHRLLLPHFYILGLCIRSFPLASTFLGCVWDGYYNWKVSFESSTSHNVRRPFTKILPST